MNTDFLIGRNFQRKRAFQQKKALPRTNEHTLFGNHRHEHYFFEFCLTGHEESGNTLANAQSRASLWRRKRTLPFPDINGMNLLGDNISLPPIVPKSFHIMLTVFHPETLYGMKKWLPFCEDLRKQYKHTPTPVEYSILLVLQPPPIEGDVPAFTQALGDFPDFT